MKAHITLIIIAVNLMVASHSLRGDSSSVGSQVEAFWKANNISQLSTYLQGLQTSSPDSAPSVVALAFYDYIFLGKLNDAKNKLNRIASAAQGNPQVFTAEYVESLNSGIKELNDEIRIQTAHGKTASDLEASANAQSVRTASGDISIPFIELIKDTPPQALPQQ